MKFFRFIISAVLLLVVYSCGNSRKNIADLVPEYKLIKNFSKDVEKATGLVLSSYGINNFLPKEYKCVNGVTSFTANYKLLKSRQDQVSVDEARELIIGLLDGFLGEINSNQEVKSHLDIYPFTSDLLVISVYFKDENQIDLGQGVAAVHLMKGQLEYEKYDISEYTGKYPAVGRHYAFLKETVLEARSKIQ